MTRYSGSCPKMREDMRFKIILAAGFGFLMAGTAPTLAQDYTSVSVTQIVLTNVTVTSGSYAAQASS